MRNRCLPCRWIVVNVGIVLAMLTGVLLVCSDLHTAANDRSQRAEILQRLLFLNVIQKLEEPVPER